MAEDGIEKGPGNLTNRGRISGLEKKVEASVARRLRAPPESATPQDLFPSEGAAYAATATGA